MNNNHTSIPKKQLSGETQINKTIMNKLLLVDGNAILHRAYHSTPPFKTSTGMVTNAIYGFLRMFIDVMKKEKPSFVAIAWDRKAPTYRHTEFKEYKATRSAPPDDLYPQMPKLKEVLSTLNIKSVEMDGYEADDLLGTMAYLAEQTNEYETIILTGDRDAFQLVTSKTSVMTPVRGISEVIVYNPEKVKEKMGVNPDQIVDYKALCGDTSDNIPGVPGIGPKQAENLLNKYHNFENIYAHLEELGDGQKKKLLNGKESGILSKRIATIQVEAPIEGDISQFKIVPIDQENFAKYLLELEFKSLFAKKDEIARIFDLNHQKNNPQNNETTINKIAEEKEETPVLIQQSLF